LSAAGRTDESVARYREAVRLRPEDAAARSELQRLMGADASAEPPATNEFDALLRSGSQAAGSGHFTEAIRAFTDAAALQPDDVRAHLGLAGALIAAQRQDEALPHLRQAVELDPRRPEPHLEIGRILADRGEFAAAIENYKQALALDPASIPTRYNLATALASLGKLDEAIAAMQACLEHARAARRTDVIPRIEDRLTRLHAERDRG